MFLIYFALYFKQFDFYLNYNIDHGSPYLSWIYIDFCVLYNSDLKHSLKSIFFHIFILDQRSKHWIFIRLISSVAKLESIQTIIFKFISLFFIFVFQSFPIYFKFEFALKMNCTHLHILNFYSKTWFLMSIF